MTLGNERRRGRSRARYNLRRGGSTAGLALLAAVLLLPSSGMPIVGVAGRVGAQDRPRPPSSSPPMVSARGSEGDSIIHDAGDGSVRPEHRSPAHRALRCVRCHQQALSSRSADDSLAPPEDSCRPCHDSDLPVPGAASLGRRDRPGARCSLCHGDPVATRARAATDRHVSFSHRRHVRSGMRCLDCHGADDGGGAPRPTLPSMQLCLDCHRSGRVTAANACRDCHESLPDGRLRTNFADGDLVPRGLLRGMAHDRDWMVRHRWVGADQGATCAACHRESDCTDCHDGRRSVQTVHPNDWLTLHSTMARRDQPRCGSCHTLTTFCGECHARLGISQISAPDVRRRSRYHPPASEWMRGPNRHATEARLALSACVSCHAEQDCVGCHGALGVGSGFSPHPPGFRDRCATALRNNDRACRRCHGDLAAVATECR